ncbi:MAG TPA: hypothetical protein VJ201_04990 [Candidatus Babeliales bacterium]|nr:hypothetical protein [Candidatus Babeliales bacterium]
MKKLKRVELMRFRREITSMIYKISFIAILLIFGISLEAKKNVKRKALPKKSQITENSKKDKPKSPQEAIERIFGFLKIDPNADYKSKHSYDRLKPQEFFNHIGVDWTDFIDKNLKIIDTDLKPLLPELSGRATITIEKSSTTGGPMLHLQFMAQDVSRDSIFTQKGKFDLDLYIEIPPVFPFIGIIAVLKISQDVKFKFRGIDPKYKSFDAAFDMEGELIVILSTWQKRWSTITGPAENEGTSKDYTQKGPDDFITTKQGFTVTGKMTPKGFIKSMALKFKQELTQKLRFNIGATIGSIMGEITIKQQIKPAISLFDPQVEKIMKWKIGVQSLTQRISLTEKVKGPLVTTELLVELRLGMSITPPGITVPYDAVGTGSITLVLLEETVPIGTWNLAVTVTQAHAKRSWHPFDGHGPVAIHNLAFQIDFLGSWIPIALGIGGDILYHGKNIGIYGKITVKNPWEGLLIAKIPKHFKLMPFSLLETINKSNSEYMVTGDPWGKIYIDNAQLYISPTVGQIGRSFFKPGFLLQGDLHILNNTIKTKFGIDASGFAGYTKSNNPLLIEQIGNDKLILSDAQNNKKGPIIDFLLRTWDATTPLAQALDKKSKIESHAIISGKLSFGKIFALAGDLHLTKDGFEISQGTDLFNLESFLSVIIPFLAREKITIKADLEKGVNKIVNSYLETCEKVLKTMKCKEPNCKSVKLSCKEICNQNCSTIAPFPINKTCHSTCNSLCGKDEQTIESTLQTWMCGSPEKCTKWLEYAYKKECDEEKYGCKKWNKKIENICNPDAIKLVQENKKAVVKEFIYVGTLDELARGKLSHVKVKFEKDGKEITETIAEFDLKDSTAMLNKIMPLFT